MAKMLYEGKAKKVFETENPNEVIIYYKDDATAMNGLKKGTIADKGIMNNTITSFFFDLLAKHGIPHHQIKKLSDREALCKKVSIIPMEVVTRNIAAGSLAKKMGVEEGYVMKRRSWRSDDQRRLCRSFWLGNRCTGCRNQSLRPEDQRNLKSLFG